VETLVSWGLGAGEEQSEAAAGCPEFGVPVVSHTTITVSVVSHTAVDASVTSHTSIELDAGC